MLDGRGNVEFQMTMSNRKFDFLIGKLSLNLNYSRFHTDKNQGGYARASGV